MTPAVPPRRGPESIPFDPARPFRRSEALAAGITDDELSGEVYERLFHGWYVALREPAQIWHRARAALRACPPGSYVSHHTAAALWGGIAPADASIHVSVPAGGYRPQRRGIVAHYVGAPPDPVRHRTLLMSSASRVFLEVAAACRSLVELVVLGDSLVRKRRTTPEALVAAAASYSGRGVRTARRAASYVREGVDSPTESRLRMLIVLARLPEPVVDRKKRDEIGEWVRRFDLSYPAAKLIVEYDGRHHRDVRAQWSKDLRRREELEHDGWRVVVLTADDLYGDPAGTVERIRRAMADCGLRPSRRVPLEWQRSFGPSGLAA